MSLHTWSKWEPKLKEFLEQPRLLEQLNEHQELNAHMDEKGRITYTKLVNRQSFGAFRDTVIGIVPRETIGKIPSIARILKRYAWVYPKYYVQYASLDEADYEYEDMDQIDDVIDTLRDAPLKKPLIGICILDNEGAVLFHGTAFIAWRTGKNRYVFAYYDPLAYQRFRKREDGTTYAINYDYARMTFQSRRFEHRIQFIDLSQYCLRKGQEGEYHCPQYSMDAEYCYINSLFFLYKWVQLGSSISNQGLQRAVEACYIIDPEMLTRSNNRETMVYRMVMMSFIVSSLIVYLKGLTKTGANYIHSEKQVRDWLRELVEYSHSWEQKYGFTIIHPSLYRSRVLDRKVAPSS